MGFSEAVQWWEEKQLSVLVLSSLSFQYILFIAALSRKYRVPAVCRSLTYLAYLGSDAVAIYALATLFNRHRNQEWLAKHQSSASLEVLWAPILLLHLGGQDLITAYGIEDNEMWPRHILTALSQLTVAFYVFWKSWPRDKRLYQATILVFVPGILKCFEKPWALKSASISSLVKAEVQTSSSSDDQISGIHINSLDEYVQAAVLNAQANKPSDDKLEPRPYNLFVDLQYPYHVRLRNQRCMLHCKQGEAHRLVKSELSASFNRLYTKQEILYGIDSDHAKEDIRATCAVFLRELVVCLTFVAIGIFHHSHREDYDAADVKITYTLLSCTAALELLLFVATSCYSGSSIEDPWPEHVAQRSLLGHLARDRKLAWVMKPAASLRCKGYLDQLWAMEPSLSSRGITRRVHGHLVDGWKKSITDTATYRSFNDRRGQLTLKREGRTDVEWSLRRPFDESVLLWHLATDLCFHHPAASCGGNEIARRCRAMSNYMVHLLYINPEMLMAGSRSSLFTAACDQLHSTLAVADEKEKTQNQKDTDPVNERELAHKIIHEVKGGDGSGFVHEAWALTAALMGSGGEGEEEEKMWKVVEAVWVEMLCFSAGRCRGYLHAKSLGKGGEYLSYVWMLLHFMGMESQAERLQRTELRGEGDVGASGLTPARDVAVV